MVQDSQIKGGNTDCNSLSPLMLVYMAEALSIEDLAAQTFMRRMRANNG